jgi:tetratricopeptide (TPR) repeat protein
LPEGSKKIASFSGQLGNISLRRGEVDQALEWYQKALQIDEELGDRAGMASTISQIGVLLTKRGSPAEAVPLNLRSLRIRLQLQSPQVRIDLYWLRRQRELLGEERFGEILREQLAGDDISAVLEMTEKTDGT